MPRRRFRYTSRQSQHTLVVQSLTGQIARYNFTVEGTVQAGGTGELAGGDFDTITDNGDGTMTVEGVTGDPPTSGDTWVIDGTLLSFTFTQNQAALFWDGRAIDPSDTPLPPPECSVDRDCPVGEVCDGGSCVPAPPECTADSDCGPDEVCDGGTCVPAQTGCVADSDCPAGQMCEGGECVPVTQPPGDGPGLDLGIFAIAAVGGFAVAKAYRNRK